MTLSRSLRLYLFLATLLFAANSLAQPTLILPPGALNTTTTPSATVNPIVKADNSNLDTAEQYLTVTFGGVPAGQSISNGTYLGWCPDLFDILRTNENYTLYS